MHILSIFNYDQSNHWVNYRNQASMSLVSGRVGVACRCSALMMGTEPLVKWGSWCLHWTDGLHFRQYFAQLSHLNCTARAKHGSQTPKLGAFVHFRQSVVIGLMGCFHNVPSVRLSWTTLQVQLSGMDGSWMDSATGVIA